MAEEKRKRVELALKKEGIPVNDDTIRAFEIALKLKVIEVATTHTRIAFVPAREFA